MAAYPSDGYLGEETGYEEATGDSGIWVVDPIDGTQPFLSGLRKWCVSIAYVRSNEVVLGMVNNPATGELFIGGAGRMAFYSSHSVTKSGDWRGSVRPHNRLARSRTCAGCYRVPQGPARRALGVPRIRW